MRIAGVTATLAATAVLAGGCNATTSPDTSSVPSPYVSENPDSSTTLDYPISRKNYYPVDGRWEFCFDEPSGSWVCIPVSADDYQRYDVGDRITLRQDVGKLAVISSQ